MKIVKLEEKHLEDLAEIDLMSNAPWTKDSFKTELSNGVARYYVAENDDGKAIGYVGYWWSFYEIQITFLAVHENVRRQGVAKALMQYVYDECVEMGTETIQLEVRSGNLSAISLYKNLGFVEVGVRPKYYGGTEDALLMDLAVKPKGNEIDG